LAPELFCETIFSPFMPIVPVRVRLVRAGYTFGQGKCRGEIKAYLTISYVPKVSPLKFFLCKMKIGPKTRKSPNAHAHTDQIFVLAMCTLFTSYSLFRTFRIPERRHVLHKRTPLQA
jgi:hypothetical protein